MCAAAVGSNLFVLGELNATAKEAFKAVEASGHYNTPNHKLERKRCENPSAPLHSLAVKALDPSTPQETLRKRLNLMANYTLTPEQTDLLSRIDCIRAWKFVVEQSLDSGCFIPIFLPSDPVPSADKDLWTAKFCAEEIRKYIDNPNQVFLSCVVVHASLDPSMEITETFIKRMGVYRPLIDTSPLEEAEKIKRKIPKLGLGISAEKFSAILDRYSRKSIMDLMRCTSHSAKKLLEREQKRLETFYASACGAERSSCS